MVIEMDQNIQKPSIRFKGFTDAWEQCKLGDMAESFEYGLNASAKEYDGINKYLRITDIDEDTRLFKTGDLTSPNIDYNGSDNYLLKNGDILFARTGASVGKSYIYKENDGKVYFAGFLIRARIKSNYNPQFIYQTTLRDEYSKKIMITSQRSGQPGVNAKEYSNFEFLIPSYEEQVKIGEHFEKIDNLITLHQRKYDKLVNTKKALLDKMFPKAGEATPKLRFRGFTDTWEQCKYGEIADTKRGLTYKPADVTGNGVRVLRSSNINEDTFEQREDDVFVRSEAINIDYANSGDILITSANGSSRLVGKHAIINNLADNTAVHGGFMLLAKTNYPYFLNASMSSRWYEKFINLYVAGGNGAIGNLSKSNLDDYDILVPSNSEKLKLGEFFQAIDSLITLHQLKYEKLKNIKKALLQKMFV